MFASLKNKFFGLLILLFPALLISCDSDETVAPPKPRPVITFVVPEKSQENNRRFSGETQAARSVDLGFELAGRIEAIFAEEGKPYPKGTPLAQLDRSNVDAERDNAQAQDDQAIQQLRRAQELHESGNASQADFDTAIASQKATEARLASAELAVGYTTLKMPYDGIVTDIPADVNQVVAAGNPVIAIQGKLGMNFETSVPTSVISHIKEKQKVTLTLSDLAGQKITGTVIKISPVASSNTTYPITIAIDDPSSTTNLRSGLDGEASFDFPIEGQQGFALPGTAILASPDGSNYVWLVDQPEGNTSTVSRVPVTIGNLTGGGKLEVLTGLATGQVIVSKGVQSLTPGMEVTLLKD